MKLPRIIGILFFLLQTAQAQRQVRFEALTQKEGLTSNHVTTVLQDRNGFIWAGTRWGLNRYDGRVIKQYMTMGPGGLTDLTITCLAEDADGNIWAGTENGLNRINPFTETITQYRQGRGKGTIPFNWCNYLYTSRNGRLWLTTEKGLALYHPAADSFANYPVAVTGSDARQNRFIMQVYEDKAGRMWLATSYGVQLFSPAAKTVRSFHLPETAGQQRQENIITGIDEDEAGGLYAKTWKGQLLQWVEAESRFKVVPGAVLYGGVDNSPAEVTACGGAVFALDAANEQPASSRGRLLQDSSGGKPVFIWLNKWMRGRQGICWTASTGGLYKADPARQAVEWLWPSGTSGPEGTLYHIIPGAADDYFITSTMGWWRWGPGQNRVEPVTLPPNGGAMLKEINLHVRNGTGIWFTSLQGAGYYDFNIRRVRRIPNPDAALPPQTPYRCWALCRDSSGRIWFSVYRDGVRVYDPVLKKVFNPFAGNASGIPAQRRVVSLAVTANGDIWILGDDGLYQVKPGDFSVTPRLVNGIFKDLRLKGNHLLVTRNGRLLMSGQQHIYAWQNNRMEPVFPRQGGASFLIDRVVEDDAGHFWLLTNTGIYRTNAGFEQLSNMTAALQTETGQFTAELLVTPRGHGLLLSGNRLGLFSLRQLERPPAPPGVLINRVKAGGHEFFLHSGGQRFKIQYKDAVEFEVSAIHFSGEQENGIFYRLEGWDDEWKELTGVPVVRYQQLPPGRYTFKARSRNGGGVWSQAEALVQFTIKPPFYRAWWFIALCVAVTAGAAYGIYRYRLAKAVEMEKLRTRIATDLHDDIGATLSSISMYSETLKGQVKDKLPHLEKVLDKMGENSRSMVGNMSDIVWAINPANDEGVKLLSRAEDYARDICAAKNIKLVFNGHEKINSLQLTAGQRRNIYLVFKEAVNNAVKYSGAAVIYVEWMLNGKNLSLTVRDDGRGFDTDATPNGNGLRNMLQRTQAMNGRFSLRSAPGAGTEIRLDCEV